MHPCGGRRQGCTTHRVTTATAAATISILNALLPSPGKLWRQEDETKV